MSASLFPCRPRIVQPIQNAAKSAHIQFAIQVPSRNTEARHAGAGQAWALLPTFPIADRSRSTRIEGLAVFIHAAEREQLAFPNARRQRAPLEIWQRQLLPAGFRLGEIVNECIRLPVTRRSLFRAICLPIANRRRRTACRRSRPRCATSAPAGSGVRAVHFWSPDHTRQIRPWSAGPPSSFSVAIANIQTADAIDLAAVGHERQPLQRRLHRQLLPLRAAIELERGGSASKDSRPNVRALRRCDRRKRTANRRPPRAPKLATGSGNGGNRRHALEPRCGHCLRLRRCGFFLPRSSFAGSIERQRCIVHHAFVRLAVELAGFVLLHRVRQHADESAVFRLECSRGRLRPPSLRSDRCRPRRSSRPRPRAACRPNSTSSSTSPSLIVGTISSFRSFDVPAALIVVGRRAANVLRVILQQRRP